MHDGAACAIGDWIITRQNDRRLSVRDGGHVRNGATWTVTRVHSDGSIDVSPREHGELTKHQGKTQQLSWPGSVRLPARYTREHVGLGYATTIHRAQGATVDTAHVLACAGMTRQALYVAMTRGRHANHAYVALDGIANSEVHHQGGDLTGAQILKRILATDGAEYSATATLRHRQNDATASRRLLPIRDTLRAGHEIETAKELTRLISIRAALKRAAATLPTDRRPSTTAHRPQGPHRTGPDPVGR